MDLITTFENKIIVENAGVSEMESVFLDSIVAVKFTAKQANSTVGFKSISSNQTLEYSIDHGNTWEKFTIDNIIILSSVGSIIYIRGFLFNSNQSSNYTQFEISGDVSVSGNINALWNYQNLNVPLKPLCAYNLFKSCNGLTDASELALPSTTLAGSCYSMMFADCPNLIHGPALPATTLATGCYQYMFDNCISLVKAPELPAITMVNGCYQYMFSDCISLVEAPELPATTLASGCYCCMFEGCINLEKCPSLPANILIPYCYHGMFDRCTKITKAPELPAERLVDGCYNSMFNNCTNLKYIKCLAVDISANECTKNWVNGVVYSGVFIKKRLMSNWTIGVNGIPNVWDIENELVVDDPVVTTVDSEIIVTTETIGADIYYRLNESGTYDLYTKPIVYNNKTIIEAYVEYGGITSNVVSAVCEPHDYSLDYLTFKILSDGTIGWQSNGTDAAKTIQYCKNGDRWISITATSIPVTISVKIGDIIRFKGINTRYCEGNKNNFSGFNGGTATFNVQGNIMSLISGDDFSDITTLPGDWTFTQLFKNSKVVSAENLILPAVILTDSCYRAMFSFVTTLTVAPKLPATTLATYCYWYMFEGCSSLVNIPELPATELKNSCYYGMFSDCTMLTSAPELPATKLVNSCYASMFRGCTSLKITPELPAKILASYCYDSMFENCISLITVQKILPATTLTSAYYCYHKMFAGCESLTTAPELPATVLTNNCYNSMFSDCVVLTKAPKLPATVLTYKCYYNMFDGCTKLKQIECLSTDISANECTTKWVNGVSKKGIFVKNSNISNWTNGINGIPNNWIIQNN